jgi:hypothetical protein
MRLLTRGGVGQAEPHAAGRPRQAGPRRRISRPATADLVSRGGGTTEEVAGQRKSGAVALQESRRMKNQFSLSYRVPDVKMQERKVVWYRIR